MTEIIIALISFLGTALGTLGGIIAAGKLTAFRLTQLENKVDTLGRFASRMPVVEEQIKVINHRLNDLEREEK